MRIRVTPACLTFFVVAALVTTADGQELPSDWANTYVHGEWQGKCDVGGGRGGCRGGNTYYFDADAGVLLNFFSSAPPPTSILMVASSAGGCAGGTVSVEGGMTIELTSAGDYCTVGNKLFREASRITNAQSQLDIGMFRNAATVRVQVQTADGNESTATIPTDGFSEKLAAAMRP